MSTAESKSKATESKSIAKTEQQSRDKTQTLALREPRLPYHPLIEARFGVDKASWKALVEAIFPNATTVESVILALSYCRARKLDPFKRNVHIVPIWNKDLKAMVDTIWPGIGELRTTAFRTGEYAGRGHTAFGPDVTKTFGELKITFPEWAQVTVSRMVRGEKVEFCGPQVYWLETYASNRDGSPNQMWADRPRGQIDKCAEAAALRAAFPEECGGEYIPEEVAHGRPVTLEQAEETAATRTEALEHRLGSMLPGGESKSEQSESDEQASGLQSANPIPDGASELLATSWKLLSLADSDLKIGGLCDEFEQSSLTDAEKKLLFDEAMHRRGAK